MDKGRKLAGGNLSSRTSKTPARFTLTQGIKTKLNPYPIGGYGSYRADIRGIGKDASDGFHIGAGVELRLGDHFICFRMATYFVIRLTLKVDGSTSLHPRSGPRPAGRGYV